MRPLAFAAPFEDGIEFVDGYGREVRKILLRFGIAQLESDSITSETRSSAHVTFCDLESTQLTRIVSSRGHFAIPVFSTPPTVALSAAILRDAFEKA